MSSAKALFTFLLCSLFLAAPVLSSPHLNSNIHHRHHALRLAGREPAPFASPRALHRRCKPRFTPSTSSTPTPTPTQQKQQPPPSPTEKKHDPPPQPPAPSPTPDKGNQGSNNNNNNQNKGDQGNNNNKGGNAGGFLAGTNSGQATFYATGLGACGITNKDSDFICAVSHELFDTFPGADAGNPNNNPVCNKGIIATIDGKDVHLTVTDRCEGCAKLDLDLSPDAFKSVTDPGRGRVPMTWRWA